MITLLRSLVLVAAVAATVRAQPGLEPEPQPTPFDRGKFGLSAGGGTTSAFGQRYFAVGAGASYYVLDGVGVGLFSQVQWGNGPTLTDVAPELRYVAQPLVGRWPVIPYAAVFYSHWFISDMVADVDAVGTRGGLMFLSGRLLFGLGVGVEKVVSECTQDCVSVYPDISIGFTL